MELSFSHTNEEIDQLIDRLLERAGDVCHPQIVREMILSSLKIGQEVDYLADLKLINRTLREMRFTARVFGPYRGRKKVTIFGSARTEPADDLFMMVLENVDTGQIRGTCQIFGAVGTAARADDKPEDKAKAAAVAKALPGW